MVIFLPKLLIAVAATVSSLMGFWQVANVLDLQHYLTLPAFEYLEPYLAVVGLGPASSSSDSKHIDEVSFGPCPTPLQTTKKDPANPTFTFPKNVAESNILNDDTLPKSDDYSHLFNLLSSQALPFENDSSGENVGPAPNEEPAFSSIFALENLASFDTLVDYVFSCVEERPSSTSGVLGFGLAAICVLGFVFIIATPLCWALPYVDLQGQAAPKAQALLPHVTDITLSDSGNENNDALSIVSSIVQSLPNSVSVPDESPLFSQVMMEAVAFATEIAQAHTNVVKKDFMELAVKLDDSTKCNDDAIAKLKEDFGSTLQSKLDSSSSELDSKLDKATNVTRIALQDIKAAIQKSDNAGTQALAEVENSVSGYDNSISAVLHEFNQLKSDLVNLRKDSSKRRTENGKLLGELEKQQKEHEDHISKLRDEADRRGAEPTNTLIALESRLHEKSNAGFKALEQKFGDVENTFHAKVGFVEASLETAKSELESKTNAVNAGLSSHQEDLAKVRCDLEKNKTLIYSKVDSKDLKKLENRLAGFASGRQVQTLSDDIANIFGQIDTKASRSSVEAVRREVDRTVARVEEGIRKASDTDVAVADISNKLGEKIDKAQLDALEQQVSSKATKDELADLLVRVEAAQDKKANRSQLDAVEDQMLSKAAKDELTDLLVKVEAAQSEKADKVQLEALEHQVSSKATKDDLEDQLLKIEVAQSQVEGMVGEFGAFETKMEAALSEMVASKSFNKLKTTVDLAWSELSRHKEQLLTKVTTADFKDTSDALTQAKSDIALLKGKMPVIQDMDFGQVKSLADLFANTTEKMRGLISNKVDNEKLTELEGKVDLKAEKLTVAEHWRIINNLTEVADQLKVDIRTRVGVCSEIGTNEIGTGFSRLSASNKSAMILPNELENLDQDNSEPEKSKQEDLEQEKSELLTKTEVSQELSEPTIAPPSDPVPLSSPTTLVSEEESSKSIAAAQTQREFTMNHLPHTTSAPADTGTVSGDLHHSSQETAASTMPLPITTGSVGQPIQTVLVARLASESSGNTMTQPSDKGEIPDKIVSALHEPAIKINVESAEKGEVAMMASRYASSPRPPLEDERNVRCPSDAQNPSALISSNPATKLLSGTNSLKDLSDSRYAPRDRAHEPPYLPYIMPRESYGQAHRFSPSNDLSASKYAPKDRAQQPLSRLASMFWPGDDCCQLSPTDLGGSKYTYAPEVQKSASPTSLKASAWSSSQETRQSASHKPQESASQKVQIPASQEAQKSASSTGLKASAWSSSQDTQQSPSQKLEESASQKVQVPASQHVQKSVSPSKTPLDVEMSTWAKAREFTPSPSHHLTLPKANGISDLDDADDSSPKVPKGPKYPPGSGPGPNGGQRKLTPQRIEHNNLQRNKTEIKKVLDRLNLTPEQRDNARDHQNRVTLRFAKGSGWDWLNPIPDKGKRAHEVGAPRWWVPPV
jgi:hypothetical protein